MSAKLMGLVWDLDLPHSEQSVLLALADHADHDGGHIYPGVDLIAWKTGYSVRQVQRILRTLEDMQIITTQSGKGGRGKATAYELHLEKGVKKSPFIRAKDDKVSPITERNGDNTSPITGERVTFRALKGDISSISTGPEPRQDQAPRLNNHHRTISNTEIHRGTVDTDVAVIGASPLVVDGDVSALCAAIAKASGAELKADALARMIERHPKLDAKSLIFEAEMASEWVADPTRNKRKRTMTIAFLHGWYKREENPQENGHGTSNGTSPSEANGRGPGTRTERSRKATEPPDPTKHGIYASFIRRD